MRKVLLAATVLISGCAFTNIPISLPRSASTQLNGGDGRQVTVIVPFRDQRPNPVRCGMQKNSYGSDTANAVCSEDPAGWIARLLADQLRSAGFKVLDDPTSDKPSTVKIEGILLQFFVEPVIGFSTISLETDIDVKLSVTTLNGLSAEREFFVKGTVEGLMATASNFQLSVDNATAQLVKDMVAAILSLTNRYPEVGNLKDAPCVASTEE